MRRSADTNINDRDYWNAIYELEHAQLAGKERVDAPRLCALARWVRIREHELQRPAAVLDVGCGFGEALHSLERQGRMLTGIDISPYAIAQNQAIFGGEPKYTWHAASVYSLGKLFPQPVFDIVWCGETLEHLDDPMGAVSLMGAVCRPQGFVVLSTPFKQRNTSPEHVWEFEPKDIHAMADSIGELVHLDCCLLPGWLTMFAAIRVGGAT